MNDIGQGPWCKGKLTREMTLRVEEIIQGYARDGVTSGIIAAKLYNDEDWQPAPSSGSDRRLDAALQRLRMAGRIEARGMSWYPVRRGVDS